MDSNNYQIVVNVRVDSDGKRWMKCPSCGGEYRAFLITQSGMTACRDCTIRYGGGKLIDFLLRGNVTINGQPATLEGLIRLGINKLASFF